MAEEKKKEEQTSKDKLTIEKPESVSTDTAMQLYLDALNVFLHDLSSNKQTQNLRQKASDIDWLLYNTKLFDKEIDNSVLKEYLITRTKIRPKVGELESEINKLKSEINQKAQALLEQELDANQKEKQIRELESKLKALGEKQSLSHLLNRVRSSAQQKLLSSTKFRALFDQDSPRQAYVLSIDIRRSTELMLKAREPKLYAQFIITLASRLRDVILENYGIFDKFTGDGILAFFPEFYSGKDAGYFAVKAASDCHKIFTAHYEANKHCFISILKDIGLGIGIDYGQVQIVQIGGDFTVVGTPVVYACRMGGADARHTFINQPAFEQLFDKYSAICDFDSREIDIKHEGKTLAYSVELNGKKYSPILPEWNTIEAASATKGEA